MESSGEWMWAIYKIFFGMEAFSVMDENKGEAKLHRRHLRSVAESYNPWRETVPPPVSQHVLQQNTYPAVYTHLPLTSLQNSLSTLACRQEYNFHWIYLTWSLNLQMIAVCGKTVLVNRVQHSFLLSLHLGRASVLYVLLEPASDRLCGSGDASTRALWWIRPRRLWLRLCGLGDRLGLPGHFHGNKEMREQLIARNTFPHC